jgi:predicted PurR-regulated permease PerM
MTDTSDHHAPLDEFPASGETTLPVPIDVRNTALTLAAIGIGIALLQFMQAVLIPFIVAGLLFYALDPAVDWLQRMRVPRALAAAGVLSVVITLAAVSTYSLQGQALTVIDQLPEGARRLAASLRGHLGDKPTAVEKVQQAADELHRSSGSCSSARLA